MSTGGEASEDRDDEATLVAEYALGLLDGAEHRRMAARIAAEPALARSLRLWRIRLANLDREFVETAPPAGVLEKVEARIFPPSPAAAPTGWWHSLALWRGLAGAGLAVAVAAVGFNLMQPRVDATAVATQLVAALQASEGSGVAFVAFYDTQTQSVRLLGIEGQPVPDRDFELWYIKGDEPAVSMGVVPIDRRADIPLNATARQKIGDGTVLAVTLEPKGGSPTGVATGPIVAVGKATAI